MAYELNTAIDLNSDARKNHFEHLINRAVDLHVEKGMDIEFAFEEACKEESFFLIELFEGRSDRSKQVRKDMRSRIYSKINANKRRI